MQQAINSSVSKSANPFKARTISQLLIKFSAPAMAGMFVNAFYNIISRVYIGNEVGALGIAGISIIFPLGLLFMAFSMLVGVGANALFSIRLGEKRYDAASLILGNAFIYLLIVSAIITTACWFYLDPILVFLGSTPDILPYAREYARPVLIGYFFFSISIGLNYFIRSSGNPKTAMGTQLIGALINIIFAPLFIFTFNLGMTGAALAVVLGQIISFIWIMIFFLRKSNPFRLRFKYFKLNKYIIKDSMKVGFAQFVFQLSGGALNTILNHSLIIYGGDLAVSAIGIVISVNTIIVMPIIGISQGAQPLVGYNYGARKYKTSIQTLKMAMRWGVVITTIGFIVVELFARPIVSIFNSTDSNLIDMSAYALRIFNLMLPIISIPILSTSFFQAINKPMKAALLSLSRQILILIPLVIILPLFFGLNGVLFAPPVSDLLATILSIVLIHRYFKKHKQTLFRFRKTPQKNKTI